MSRRVYHVDSCRTFFEAIGGEVLSVSIRSAGFGEMSSGSKALLNGVHANHATPEGAARKWLIEAGYDCEYETKITAPDGGITPPTPYTPPDEDNA